VSRSARLRASGNAENSQITYRGSGVRFSSSTEQDIDDWYSSDLLNGYGANPAVWDHAGFIGEFGLARDFSPGSSGNFAIFTAIRRASSLVSNFAADLRPGSSSK